MGPTEARTNDKQTIRTSDQPARLLNKLTLLVAGTTAHPSVTRSPVTFLVHGLHDFLLFYILSEHWFRHEAQFRIILYFVELQLAGLILIL